MEVLRSENKKKCQRENERALGKTHRSSAQFSDHRSPVENECIVNVVNVKE